MPARLSAGRGAARHSNRACRLQPAWSARWRKWIKTTHVVRSISYSSSRARGFSLYLAMQTQQKPRRGGRPQGFHLDCARAQRVKSLFRRAGDRYRSATRENWPQAGRAALTPGGRAHRAFYWPSGREICHEKPGPRVPNGTLKGEKSPLSATARLPENKNHKTGHPHEHKNVTFVEQWLLATTLSTLH